VRIVICDFVSMNPLECPIHYQYFTKTKEVPENRGAGYARTPVFGLPLINS
jgi:hypothetical protein